MTTQEDPHANQPPLVRFYNRNRDSGSRSWYELSREQQDYWRQRYRQAQARVRRTLNQGG